jgi:uncharacterized NAD(P)/FAD-binding protein YdhS
MDVLSPFEALPADRLAQARSIALIGSGLTMVDVLLNARRSGFKGFAAIVSRRGQLPRPHAPKGVIPQTISLPASKSVSLLTAAIRLACEAAEAHGTPWQSVINGLRPSMQELWRGLPLQEQARFLRHLRPYWDTCRHRLPLQVHAKLQAELQEGRAAHVRGRVVEAVCVEDRYRFRVTRCGSKATVPLETDLAFDCSGYRADLKSPLIESIVAQGLAKADPHRLGLAVLPDGKVLGGTAGRRGASMRSGRSAKAVCGRLLPCRKSCGRLLPRCRAWPRFSPAGACKRARRISF